MIKNNKVVFDNNAAAALYIIIITIPSERFLRTHDHKLPTRRAVTVL